MSEGREIARRLTLAAGGLVCAAFCLIGAGLVIDSSQKADGVGLILGSLAGFEIWRRLVNWVLLHKPAPRPTDLPF